MRPKLPNRSPGFRSTSVSPFSNMDTRSQSGIPRHGRNDWPAVVVASVFQTGLNLMRDFERKRVLAVGVDHIREHEGFRSRYGRSYHCPNPETHAAGWVAFMKSLARQIGGRPALIPAADEYVTALARHAGELQGYYLLSPEAAALQGALGNKQEQYAMARQRGFPCPRSEAVGSAAGLRDFIKKANFPCLLKPRQHREWADLPEGNPLRGRKLI